MEHSYAIILRHVSFIIRQARAMSALSNVSNSIKTYFTKYRSKNFHDGASQEKGGQERSMTP